MKLKTFHSVDCADGHERCEEWANAGECDINPDWMLENCQVSCGTCEGKTKGKSLKILFIYIYIF